MPETSSRSPQLGRNAIKARNAVVKRIKNDHKAFKEAVRRFGKLDQREDRVEIDKLVGQFVADLRFHSHFEQAHLYPAVQASCENRHVTELAEVEHESIAVLLDKLQKRRAGDDHFAALFQAISEQLLRHVRREEAEVLGLLKQAPLDWPALANLMAQSDRPIEATSRAVLTAEPAGSPELPANPDIDDVLEPATVLATPDTPAERRAAARSAPIK